MRRAGDALDIGTTGIKPVVNARGDKLSDDQRDCHYAHNQEQKRQSK